MGTASAAFTWLKGRGQIPGIADSNGSCLTYLGGDMPPRGPTDDAKAVSDLQAWAAAGAQND
jgi:hypothetical protein